MWVERINRLQKYLLLNSDLDDISATEFEQLFELGDGGICAKNEEWDGKKSGSHSWNTCLGQKKNEGRKIILEGLL
ncbi:hypothetical protein TNCV_4634521 [Trichonephila clavipes]|nr:hypothetical protein TNCV_4634521 [Trichonephila clavipes]